ncbi:MAG: SAM-dependent chlorinase/fluorinase [Proteobacteria bacterium]|nr:SAM-dependent chlorinase/fluorinase [Pseudomonadota bacterium]
MAPIVTLTTDFGTRDAYLAQMKGVLLTEGPHDLRVVDLSHEISTHDTKEAALFVRAAIPRFPEGTIHVVIVDPGVGGVRRPIVACVRGQLLVGPDNATFGYLLDGSEQVYEIQPARLERAHISSTFHGRDIFAPAAARLAAGATPESLGARVEHYKRLVFPLVQVRNRELLGTVIHIDRFGNLISNISEGTLRGFLQGVSPERVVVYVGGHRVQGLSTHYEQTHAGELLALVGSDDLFEVAARNKSAATKLNVSVGQSVRVVTETHTHAG